METKNARKCKKFICEKCDYISFNKSNYNMHLLTAKHKSLCKNENFLCETTENGNAWKQKMQENAKIENCYECSSCFREFKTRSGLWKHKKSCVYYENKKSDNNKEDNNKAYNNKEDLKELVCKLITENNEIKNTIVKENDELRKQVNNLLPKLGNTTNNTNNTNNTINNFNIKVFLNNDCKNAMNIDDFIKSIKVSLNQLDLTNIEGLESGISNIIIENIKKLNIHDRPLHCTDTKRETLYIKDNNIWEKDNDKTKIKKAIIETSDKQYDALKEWIENNPELKENEDKQQYFTKMISMIGKKNNKIDDKIIKKICAETYIKK